MLDCRFNLTKFEEVFLLSMTKNMSAELLECLEEFEDFNQYPYMASLRRHLRGILNHKGRSVVHPMPSSSRRRLFNGIPKGDITPTAQNGGDTQVTEG